MKVYSQTGIFATDKPTQDASDAPESVETSEQAEVIEHAQNAIKRASEVIQAGKPEEVTELSAYDKYRALQDTCPREAGIYYEANKAAILACIND